MSRRPKDPEAFERKVRPIYDALDSRNWKGALKLCQQTLQKYPDNELVRVLKAVGLDRSGKRDEANQLVDEVAAGSPTDDQVLRLAAMVMRSSGRLADITRMYEAAAAVAATQPGCGDQALGLLHGVFGAHVRESNYVKQQQVALRLSKALAGMAAAGVSSERYSWWVIVSLLLQARAALRARTSGVPAPPGQVPAVALEPEKMLALVEGMISRQASKDGKLEGYEAVMVYVDVLLAQGKVSDALKLVSGPLGAAAIRLPSERLQLRAVLSALTGDLEAAAALLREGLALNPDDWGALLLLLDCMLPGTAAAARSGTQVSAAGADAAAATFTPQHPLVLISGGVAEQLPPKGLPIPPDGGASADAFTQAEAVIKALVALESESSAATEGSNNGGKPMIMRGPDLALVDLAMRRHRALSGATPTTSPDAAAEAEASLRAAILSYFQQYGSLVSCAVDLRTYVSQLSDAAAEQLAQAVQQEADAAAAAGGSGDNQARLSCLRRRVCAAQIRDDLGQPRLESCEQGAKVAGELLQLYSTAQPLQEGLDQRERGAADELPVLAASALATSAALAPSDAGAVPYMLAAYGALSDAVKHRPYSAGMRISLSALAALLGVPAAAAAHLYKLDIKHIQLDTLGSHVLLPALLAWPAAGNVGTAAAADGASAGGQQGQGQGQGLLHRALRDTRTLFDDHGRDAGETLFTAYNHGMYTKVLEFTAFRERLASAHTQAVVRAEAAVVECLQGQGGPASSGTAEGGAGEAMRQAATTAAANLKTDQLPATGSLRFNWDLSTRPPWLPPCDASPSFHVLEWWRSRARGDTRGQGYGRCWWSATGSAEGPSPAASRWRAAQASAAAHRWLLPHCIAGALGASSPEILPLGDAVERMRSQIQAESSTPNGAAAAVGQPADAASALPGSSELRRLDLSLYECALAVQVALKPTGVLAAAVRGVAAGSAAAAAPTAPSAEAVEDGNVDAACAALAKLSEALRAVAGSTITALATSREQAAAWGGVLPGGALAIVSYLLREPLPVLTACLQVWQAAFKNLKKRRTKAGTPLEEGAQRLAVAVASTAEEMGTVARAYGDALAAGLASGGAGSAATAVEQLTSFLKGHGAPPASLSATAAAALESLLEEQRSTLAALSKQAGAVAAALS